MSLSNIRPFLYLFVMDASRISFESYVEYEQGEPGFDVPFFLAYITAFQESNDGQLTHELLKKINAVALRHLSDIPRGQYREIAGNFLIGIQEYRNRISPCYSATKEGIYEFIDFWLNRETAVHCLSFELKNNPLLSAFVVKRKNSGIVFQTINDKNIVSEKPYNMKDIQALISNFKYDLYINTMMHNDDPTVIQAETENILKSIFDEYL
jgi:hypothetical protein